MKKKTEWQRQLARALTFASKDKTRPALCGVRIDVDEDEYVVAVATDGNRLACIRLADGHPFGAGGFTLPVLAVQAWIEYGDDCVLDTTPCPRTDGKEYDGGSRYGSYGRDTGKCADNNADHGGGTTVHGTRIPHLCERFPDYSRVIPQDGFTAELFLSWAPFAAAYDVIKPLWQWTPAEKAAFAAVGKKAPNLDPLKSHVEAQTLRLDACGNVTIPLRKVTPAGARELGAPVADDADPLAAVWLDVPLATDGEIGLNPLYLRAALGDATAARVRWENGHNPVRIDHDGEIQVIMPVRL